MPDFRLTDEQVQQFNDDGYIILPKRFDAEEMDLLLKIGRGDKQLAAEAHGTKDAQGGVSKLTLRNHLTEGDMYSAFVQCHRIIDPVEQLMQDEVYHFHHKMMIKEPRVGGAWEWHQDYGYWYKFNHCLWPDMVSALIAVDRANKANGCLQVLRGSHKCGRIEHGTSGTQTGADLQRVEQLMKRLELVYVELEPGDLLIFHCNTLHRSDQNRSENPRWSLICCYNTKHNDPFVKVERGHPNYSYLERIDDSKVKEIGRAQLATIQSQLSQPA